MGTPPLPLVSACVPCAFGQADRGWFALQAEHTWANLHGLYVHFGPSLALNKWQIRSLPG